MITFNVSGSQVAIPTQWEEVTFKQYCEILNGVTSQAELIAMFTGINCETVKKATIIGLEKVILALKFLDKVPVIPDSVSKIGPYDLKTPVNIQFESLAQFEDIRSEVIKAPKDIKGFTKSYSTYVAIYLQKVRDGEYSYSKALEMVAEVENMPALEVISLGSFFFVKLMSLIRGIDPNSLRTNQSQKKSKRGTTSSRKRSVSTGRSRKRR